MQNSLTSRVILPSGFLDHFRNLIPESSHELLFRTARILSDVTPFIQKGGFC